MERVPLAQVSAAILLGMPEAALLRYLNSAPRRALVEIYRLGLVCRCSWFKGHGYGLRSAGCDADGVPVGRIIPCPHMDRPTLPASACSVVLARLWPKDYADPPSDQASGAASYRECLRLRIDRARRRRSLWHPGDAQKSGLDGLASALGIRVARERNGDIAEVGLVPLASLSSDEFDFERSGRGSGGPIEADDVDDVATIKQRVGYLETALKIRGRKS